MKFDVYTDPGHGWLKVPVSKLKEYGVHDDISQYSYYRNGYAFLEEDCDAGKFIKAVEATGKKVEFRVHYANKSSKIRNYSLYHPIHAED